MAEALICDYVRTPIGRFGGSLSSVRADDLAAVPLAALLERNPELDPSAIGEVLMGCANQAGEDNRNVARMSLLLASYPQSVPGVTVNRLCGSGMDALLTGARLIACGDADIVVAGGVESMSRAPFVMGKAESAFSRSSSIQDTTSGWRFVNPRMHNEFGTDSMPETAENVAEDFGISREDQDRFALRSQEKAKRAQESGRLAKEIEPVTIPARRGDPRVVRSDEHPRDTSLEKLTALRALFRAGGSVTAGNASGINDGAAALLLASPQAAAKHGLKPIARIVGGATAGVEPRVMGIGPVPASRKLCEKAGLSLADFDVIEFNEAFASQCLAVVRELGLRDDDERINPNGGAIALGHPLGMSGARIAGSAAIELRESGARLALAAMCVGVGQGIALALEAA